MYSTLQWFGRTTLALLLVVGLPQFAHAAFIDLVSQSYRIQERVFGCCSTVVDLDETSATPISRTDSGVVYNPEPYGAGGYYASMSTNGGITPLSAFVSANSDEYDLSFAYVGIADASAAITFRPLVTDVVVQNARSFPAFFGPSGLYDETAGAGVLAFRSGAGPAAYNVSLNLEHVYTIYASAGTGPLRGVTLSISSAGPASVPESGSTLTFFVVGLGALLLVARSQKFLPLRV